VSQVNKLILDTNILQYGVSRDLNTEVASLLTSLTSRGYGLVVSGFTVFEVYRGLNKQKIPVTRQLVKSITPLEVDNDTFRIAAVLYTCYRSHEATKDKNKWDDDGDVVIGANAFRYNAAILTANGNDYPRPFFAEIDKFVLKRSSNKAEIVVHLLRPDLAVFNTTMKKCLGSPDSKT
jgi:predicted nucleic acid-binding protein